MDRREYEERDTRESYRMPRSPFNPVVLVAVILVIIAALVFVVAAGAVDLSRIFGLKSVVRVPRDYSTVQAAIEAANAGEIIQVDAGVYAENLFISKPVTLVASTFDQANPANNSVAIDGGGAGPAIVIAPGLTQMPVIRGFIIRNGTDGIQASSAFVAEYNFFQSSGNLVSYQQGGGGFNRNNVYFRAANNAIHIDNIDKPLLIENNRILYSGETGLEIALQGASAPPALVEVDIWNNMIIGNGEDGIQLVDFAEEPQNTNRRFVIAGNLISNNVRAGIGLMPGANTVEDYSGADMVEPVRVFNNTFYGNDFGISGGDNLVAFNNIIANSINRGVSRVQGPAGTNSVVAYTLFFNNSSDAEESNLGLGNILGVDPLFEAAPNPGPDGTWASLDDDFSGLVLRSGSPAIDKGVVQFQAADGELVPPSPLSGFTGAAPDLGWREYGAPLFMTSTATLRATITAPPTGTPVVFTPVPTLTPMPGSPTPLSASATPVTVTSLPTATVMPASPTVNTPLPAPTTTGTGTAAAQMSIESVSPITAIANTTVTMTINGSGFQPGATISFEGVQGLPQQVLGIQVVDQGTIIVMFNAQNDGSTTPQVWDIRVTNPDSSTAVLEDAFTVSPPSG